jgi:excisionase family DNA binding protein
MEISNDLTTLILNEFGKIIEDSVKESFEKFASDKSPKSEEVDLLTINQICNFLGITRQTLHSWRKSGKLPYLRMGSRIFFEKSTVLSTMRRPQDLMKGS